MKKTIQQAPPSLSRRIALATIFIAACAGNHWATAQNSLKKEPVEALWPTRPVRIIVGFPGGSSPDATARTLAEPLSRALGQPVIVERSEERRVGKECVP